jgi:Tfp pilus assembly protein PilN
VIRTNLATRPFYNERAVGVWLTAVALIVAAITLFNVWAVLYYSRRDTQGETQAGRDEARAAELRSAAARLRATVNTGELQAAAVRAQVANQLIDRRTFSWTELFNRFESTLPPNVRITSVRPDATDAGVQLSINVIARSVDDVDRFIANLEETGVFINPLSRSERITEEGQLSAALAMLYLPKPAPTAAAPTATTGRAGRRAPPSGAPTAPAPEVTR